MSDEQRALEMPSKDDCEILAGRLYRHAFNLDASPGSAQLVADLRWAARSITALQSPATEQWRPIESAPRDGVVLVCGLWNDGLWDDGTPWWNMGTCFDTGVFGDWSSDTEPTHWMPLLPYPSEPIASPRAGGGDV